MWIFITLFHIGHMHYMHQFSSVQFGRSVVSDSATPWIAAHQAPLSITNSRSSPRLTSIESVMPSSHLNLCCPLLHLPPVPPSIRVFSNESTLHMRWPKDWSFRNNKSKKRIQLLLKWVSRCLFLPQLNYENAHFILVFSSMLII